MKIDRLELIEQRIVNLRSEVCRSPENCAVEDILLLIKNELVVLREATREAAGLPAVEHHTK